MEMEIEEVLMRWVKEATPGTFEIFSDFEVEFLPPDWEKYYYEGCHTDGGNYCSYFVPVGWINPKTGGAEFYIASYSSCELGDPVFVISNEEGHLIVVEEEYLSEEEQEKAVYHPWHPDFELSEPLTLQEVTEEWEKIVQDAEEEWEAYEEWKASHGY